MFAQSLALPVEILQHLTYHVGVAGLLKIGLHYIPSVMFYRRTLQPQLFSGPQPQQLVAPRGHLEIYFLIVGKLGLEALFTIFEGGHETLSPPGDFSW